MLTGKWQDDLPGDRAKSANTFDSALNLSAPGTDHVPIKVNINHQSDRNPRSLNDLQKKYLSMAVRLDKDVLPEKLQTGINASDIKKRTSRHSNFGRPCLDVVHAGKQRSSVLSR
jgi:hypothetical protein